MAKRGGARLSVTAWNRMQSPSVNHHHHHRVSAGHARQAHCTAQAPPRNLNGANNNPAGGMWNQNPAGRGKKLQYRNTEFCPWVQQGLCIMGATCNYAHTQAELRFKPDLSRTKLCNLAERGLECNIPNCKYAHKITELRATDQFYKIGLCKFWERGSCTSGTKCRHAHGAAELRDPVGNLLGAAQAAVPLTRSGSGSSSDEAANRRTGPAAKNAKKFGAKREAAVRSDTAVLNCSRSSSGGGAYNSSARVHPAAVQGNGKRASVVGGAAVGGGEVNIIPMIHGSPPNYNKVQNATNGADSKNVRFYTKSVSDALSGTVYRKVAAATSSTSTTSTESTNSTAVRSFEGCSSSRQHGREVEEDICPQQDLCSRFFNRRATAEPDVIGSCFVRRRDSTMSVPVTGSTCSPPTSYSPQGEWHNFSNNASISGSVLASFNEHVCDDRYTTGTDNSRECSFTQRSIIGVAGSHIPRNDFTTYHHQQQSTPTCITPRSVGAASDYSSGLLHPSSSLDGGLGGFPSPDGCPLEPSPSTLWAAIDHPHSNGLLQPLAMPEAFRLGPAAYGGTNEQQFDPTITKVPPGVYGSTTTAAAAQQHNNTLDWVWKCSPDSAGSLSTSSGCSSLQTNKGAHHSVRTTATTAAPTKAAATTGCVCTAEHSTEDFTFLHPTDHRKLDSNFMVTESRLVGVPDTSGGDSSFGVHVPALPFNLSPNALACNVSPTALPCNMNTALDDGVAGGLMNTDRSSGSSTQISSVSIPTMTTTTATTTAAGVGVVAVAGNVSATATAQLESVCAVAAEDAYDLRKSQKVTLEDFAASSGELTNVHTGMQHSTNKYTNYSFNNSSSSLTANQFLEAAFVLPTVDAPIGCVGAEGAKDQHHLYSNGPTSSSQHTFNECTAMNAAHASSDFNATAAEAEAACGFLKESFDDNVLFNWCLKDEQQIFPTTHDNGDRKFDEEVLKLVYNVFAQTKLSENVEPCYMSDEATAKEVLPPNSSNDCPAPSAQITAADCGTVDKDLSAAFSACTAEAFSDFIRELLRVAAEMSCG